MQIFACVLFFVQGAMMIRISRPTLRVVNEILKGPIEEGPNNLKRAGIRPQEAKVMHGRTKWFFTVALTSVAVLFICLAIRLAVTIDVLKREKRII